MEQKRHRQNVGLSGVLTLRKAELAKAQEIVADRRAKRAKRHEHDIAMYSDSSDREDILEGIPGHFFGPGWQDAQVGEPSEAGAVSTSLEGPPAGER